MVATRRCDSVSVPPRVMESAFVSDPSRVRDQLQVAAPALTLTRELAKHLAVLSKITESLVNAVEDAIRLLHGRLAGERHVRGKVMICGNGGSAADAQHFAAELVGQRPPLPALALSVDTSGITAIANDYGFEQVFARQVLALGQPSDVLIAISTSGNSANIAAAARAATSLGIPVVGLTGQDGGVLRDLCDICLRAPSDDTQRIQETHILLLHTLWRGIQAGLEEAV